MSTVAYDTDKLAKKSDRTAGRMIPIPREHGGWGMFLTGAVLGAAVSGLNGPALLFFLAALGLYLLREPLYLMFPRSLGTNAKAAGRPAHLLRWAGIFALIAILPAALLILVWQRWLLLPLGLVGSLSLAADVALRRRRQERTTAGELMGITQVTLITPGIVYAATGQIEKAGFLWVLTLLYYVGSVPYVKLKLAHLLKRPAALGFKLRLGAPALLYQVLAVGAAIAMARAGWVPPLVTLAFVPNAVKVAYGAVDVPPRVDFKKVGWTEVRTATAFAILLILAYRV